MMAMIDIETLGPDPTAVVTTIGVAKFDWHHDVIERLDIALDWQEQLDAGRTVAASTLKWWLQQSDAARQAMLQPKSLPVRDALAVLTHTVAGCAGVWAKGPSFDITILENLFNQFDRRPPWSFRNVFDVRTMQLLDDDETRVEFKGEPHVASHDAAHQALVVKAIWRILHHV